MPLAEYASPRTVSAMDLVRLYEGLCDRTRLRLLALLQSGPLCVCHLQEVLDEPQVKVSKHLGYLRERGLVESTREGNWIIYRLPATPTFALAANLACLRDCTDPTLHRDAQRLQKLRTRLAKAKRCACPLHD
ncbi:MAG TPA: metalloregulator ArsR/SmtB family transcription factor [Opitutaceae bacterium]|nr:metalloregulator ArsR/SmtB family transcription factor [Opitutaceae bacterium]